MMKPELAQAGRGERRERRGKEGRKEGRKEAAGQGTPAGGGPALRWAAAAAGTKGQSRAGPFTGGEIASSQGKAGGLRFCRRRRRRRNIFRKLL